MAADTIVLVHGLWMTPRSWENWVSHFEKQGYKVLAPAYPGFEIEVEALRENTDIIAKLSVAEVIEHLLSVIHALEKPPIIMGHSFGGALTQVLLNRGCGVAGVAINSVPTEGVLINPPSQIKSLFPFLKNPTNYHHAVGFTREQFHYAFTNTMTLEESAPVYERYHIPTPASFVWGGVLQNIIPGPQALAVNYKNDGRAPLLFIAGTADHIMPASVNKSNANHYSHSKALTEYHEFPGRSHYTCGETGWEAVADYALEWAIKVQEKSPAPAA